MSEKESSAKIPAAGATYDSSAVKERDTMSNGKYSLTITDPENKMVGGNLTITVDIENNAMQELRASDDNGNIYEVSFRIKKLGMKSGSQPRLAEDDASTNSAGVGGASTSTTVGDVNHSGRHGDGKEHGGGKDGHDECQCCTLIGGRFACQPCACPPEA